MNTLKSITLLFALTVSQVLSADMPMVSNVQVMAPPPGAKVTAGFLTINNTSAETLTITGVSSDSIPRIEIHESVIKDDVASMVKQDELNIAAGKSLELKHGSFHLMLMDLEEAALTPGDMLTVTLHTNQGDIALQMPVMKPGMKHGEMKHKKKLDH